MALVWVAAVWSLLSIVTAAVVCAIMRGGGFGVISHEPTATQDG